MDREIKLELEKQTAERLSLVQREMSWVSEKERLALAKLKKRHACVCVGVSSPFYSRLRQRSLCLDARQL